ncbi:MAG: thiamine pyrophosphate-dependent enzyme [Syntrophales bacterium]|jgi:2-oxoglutarate ferredoxin oxidoreductase subunit beta|nr:thiamine pyrophosphate-dependent enzyme [Syntrophales bacterium]MDY0044060.1 thiamine pyrophosphate-dependent enzyme [Syntrophales bacterium]
MKNEDIFKSEAENQWCPGCPNFAILRAWKKAFERLGKSPHEVCMVSGIGQAAKLPHYLKCNYFNGLHGRAMPVALGIHAVNPHLTTVVVTGDGDCYGEGGNHLLHAFPRNPNITVAVHNNEIYALTKGQASPTTIKGETRTIQPKGVEVNPINMLALAIMNDCTFVARGYAGETGHLTDLLVEAVRHEGLSYIDIIQPCITWDIHPVEWYKKRVYKLENDYDSENREAALDKTKEWSESIPIGILYRTAPRSLFAERFRKDVTAEPLTEIEPVSRKTIIETMNKYMPGVVFS